MSIKVERPAPEAKKINSKDEFELCYLRHQYFRKAEYNPTVEEMAPYIPIIEKVSRSNYYVYRNLLQMVGFGLEDVININKVHLVSFLSLFTLDSQPSKKKEFVEVFQKKNTEDPNESNFSDKNKANFTMFLKQRMEDLIRVCRQKARNIKGLPAEEYLVYRGDKRPPYRLYNLVKDPHRFGYNKIDIATFKSIKKKAKVSQDATVFTFGDKYYVAVPVKQKQLAIHDFCCAGLDPHENDHNSDPLSRIERTYDENLWEKRMQQFSNRTKEEKKRLLLKFIALNKENKQYKEEIRTAKEIVYSLGA